MWAAAFNFIAFVVFGTKVAATIATGVVEPDVLSIAVVFAGLAGAIVWNVVTAYLGLPSSSSHALVGGIAGAAVAKAGFSVLITSGLAKIGVFIVYSPLIGLALAMILVIIVSWIVHRIRRPQRRQPDVPRPAAGVGGRLQPRPRLERRPEDDGGHPGAAHRRRPGERRLRRAPVGRALVPPGDRARARCSAVGRS